MGSARGQVKLPEKRVDLYGSILEWLSKQRAKPGRMPASDCLLRLRELAFEMQNYEEGRKKQVPLTWAGEKLARRSANREAAERFLRAVQADSGIVVSRGREIAYRHLTFQGYLAALEIAGWEDAAQHAPQNRSSTSMPNVPGSAAAHSAVRCNRLLGGPRPT